ncbi:MAG: helix-turn-helix transcriptional regulator, partial [Proteobacteria bacterium]|nr:helix-turn-helix transcriptional regulator [Pseudomonadota bacterium]
MRETYSMVTTDELFSKEVQIKPVKELIEGSVLLKELRIRENLSQDAFAARIQEIQANISRMENGKKPITKSVAK